MPEIAEMCRRQNLEVFQLHAGEELHAAVSATKPVALTWNLSNAQPGDWGFICRLWNYPHLSQTPFLFYGQLAEDQVGMKGFVVKSSNTGTLLDAILAMNPSEGSGPVLIVDDDPHVQAAHQAFVADELPGFPIRIAEDGEQALDLMKEEVPSLVLLDLVMPKLSGADVLDQMRADSHLRQVPVIILSNKMMTLVDADRIKGHANVTLQTKGIWSDAETASAMNRAIFGEDTLPAHTSGLVKLAIAYLHQNYARPISRREIAEAVGVSEDYISRIFNCDLNISPWDYLNRYRVLRSKHLLVSIDESVGHSACKVGFKDQAYFSRVFSKISGMSPQAFREKSLN